MRFQLQFEPKRIEEFASRYSYRKDDRQARAVGARAAARGHYTRPEVLTVYRWKSDRSSGLYTASDQQTESTTARVFATADEYERMEELTSLPGVGVPVGSALLFAAFPDDYPILDVRALESLGVRPRSVYPIDFWLDYLEYCRQLADSSGVSIRTLDKALWQYSRES
jgi:hypothetical protein